MSDLITRHRGQLASDPAAKRAMMIQACRDAFGRSPSEDEINPWSGGAGTYTELMQRHL